MTNDDVLYAYRLRVLASVQGARQRRRSLPDARHPPLDLLPLEERGRSLRLEILRPRGRRAPQMPNSIPVLVEQRIVAFALGFPATDRRTSPASCGARSGAASRSRPTASTACCAGTASAPGRCASVCSPATRPAGAGAGPRARASHRGLTPRRARADGLLLHRPPGGHQGRRLAVHGDRRRQRLHLGRAARHAAQPRRALRLAPWRTAPPVSWPRPAGAWSASPQITARSSATAPSTPRLPSWGPCTR